MMVLVMSEVCNKIPILAKEQLNAYTLADKM